MTKVQMKERKIKLQKKRVTIVILDVKTHAVPKRKARDKLVEDGRVQELLIGINESETEVCRKIKDKMSKFLGDTSFKYMAVSSSSDIIPAELPEGENEWSGQAVLQIANGGSIYVKPCLLLHGAHDEFSGSFTSTWPVWSTHSSEVHMRSQYQLYQHVCCFNR